MLELLGIPVDTFCNRNPAMVTFLRDGGRFGNPLVFIDIRAVEVVLLECAGGLQTRLEDGLQVFLISERWGRGDVTAAPPPTILTIDTVGEGALGTLLNEQSLS